MAGTVSGFLGAGKTTLVRHILSADHGFRVAVIMNEYGESVEGSYFQTPEGKKANMGEWVDLSNGCMCCAVKTEFVQAIESLLLKRDKFDYILIETTGAWSARHACPLALRMQCTCMAVRSCDITEHTFLLPWPTHSLKACHRPCSSTHLLLLVCTHECSFPAPSRLLVAPLSENTQT